MKVSVLMPVYKESINEINESIHSILMQTYTSFEFLIINDNPKSKSLKNYLNFEQKKDKRIKLLFNKRNLGLVKSINKGIKESCGDFIVRIDADDVSATNRIYEQLNFANKHNLDLVCSNFSDLDTGLIYFGNKDQFNQIIIKNIMSHCNIAIGPTISFDKKIMKKLHGYHDLFTDDYDLAARALMNGYRIGYQSQSLVYKRNRNNNISNNHSLEQFITNRIISNAIANNDYNKIKNVFYINSQLDNINSLDIKKFNNFKVYLNKFKKKRSFISLMNAIRYTLTSKLLFKRNLWMLFVNKIYKKYI